VNPAGTARLAVDFGTTHTVAAVENAAGIVTPLLFDASPLLRSAVHLAPDGTLLTGRDAERGALHDPGRFEPNPKLRIDERRLLLGETDLDIEDLIAAPLRRVWDEACRQLGTQPARTVLTYPVAWAASRRDVLARAAEQAGLAGLTLLPEPIAAAAYQAQGQPSPVGTVLAVYDLGGGTFDATLVRRTGADSDQDGGWSVVASAGLDDLGGIDLDASIVDHLGTTVGARDARRWRRVLSPGDQAGRRALQALREDVRGAKEQLSRATSAVVQVPGFEPAAYLSREEFEQLAAQPLGRTVDALAKLVEQTGRIDGIFLVGGSSRIPLVATLLHRRFGVAPVLVEHPELVVALGALRVGTPGPARAPGAFQAPASGGFQAPASDAFHAPASGAFQAAAPGSPAAPVSGAPGISEPVPPAAGYGQGAPPFTPAPPPRARSTGARPVRRLLPVLAAVVVLLLAGWQGYRAMRSGGAGDSPTGSATTMSTGAQAAAKGSRSLTIDKQAWYGGFQLTFGKATYDPAKDYPLTVEFKAKNTTAADDGLWASNMPMTVSFGGNPVTGRFPGSTINVGSGSTVDALVDFDLDAAPNLADGLLSIGGGDRLRATVPFATKGEHLSLAPVNLLPEQDITVGTLRFKHLSCELRGDETVAYIQVPTGNRAVACFFDVSYDGKSTDQRVAGETFRLIMPDNDPRAPARSPLEYVSKQTEERGVTVVWVIKWPAPGKYTLRIFDLDNRSSPKPVDVPLTTPAA
jgi:Ethanolamine utilization protein EutJ (predicted chaperonin)